MVEGIQLNTLKKYVGYKKVASYDNEDGAGPSTTDQVNDSTDGDNNNNNNNNKDMFSPGYWFGEKEEEQSFLPGLSKTQRVIGFFGCLVLGLFCFGMAGVCAPFLILKIRKFILLYTMGSLFTIGSFAVLWGPVNHVKHIFSYGRLPFTLAYFGSMFATLYSALVIKSTTITLIFATFQMVSLAWYIFSYVPGGTTGLKFFTKLFASTCTKTVSKSLPI